MASYKFLEKRDKYKRLIRFQVPVLNYKLSKELLRSIYSFRSFNILKSYFSPEYIDAYFEKKFYIETKDLASKVIIYKWELENKTKNFSKKIKVDNNPYFHILKKYLKLEKITLEKKNSYNFKNYIIKNKWFIYINFLRIKYFFLNLRKKNYKPSSKKRKVCIGVNFVEGCNDNLRNDFFWPKKNNIKKSVVYYLEDKKRLNNFKINSFNQLKNSHPNFKYIELWKWYKIKKLPFLEKLKNEINLLTPKNVLEEWLIAEIKNLIIQINFWYCFFEYYNIKIHFNSDEHSLSNVVRQIALKKFGGCSIGKNRSSPRKIKGDWNGFYPNDIFFIWGKDSLRGLKMSGNYFNSLVISGYPYSTSKTFKEYDAIKSQFKKKKSKIYNYVIRWSPRKK